MSSVSRFADLGLADPLLRALSDSGYESPTPIQTQAIPRILEGRDLLAAAQTGTGKTAGFTVPILQLLSTRAAARPGSGRPRCLVLTPTRELAAQVHESVETYGKHLSLRATSVFGGVNINPQFRALRGQIDIVVATPGRLLDHVGQKTVDLSCIEILVLDEADRMLDMGFINDIRRILKLLPATRQSLLFSATFSDDIRRLADGMLNDPVRVEVAARNTASELVQQHVHLVETHQKRDLLSHLIKENRWQQVLVFTRTKHGANKLAEKLSKDGIPAAAIHGNKTQAARTKALHQFKSGRIPVLVATDIAARGLDIDQLPQVVNFELPHVPEDYVHRIGRTGRAGTSGAALSLVDGEELRLLSGIERLIRRPIERIQTEGFAAPSRPANDSPRNPRPSGARPGNGARKGPPRGGPSKGPRPGGRRQGQGRSGASRGNRV
ncbi:DEAD/DEAH box helicase [Thioalkalivibrio thiocyanodenitrificans]|uniref:DEAD/DEAH box helicase n=1 Tax=Thioalkalivibrio thiocyanodenitrificans TaxID=243063 RepID=UPI0003A93EE4|nr:DEAD/DEAH box helicase [Thioalkalivibrio thiocyanodenitrificans]